MWSKDKTWSRRMLAVLALTVVVIVILAVISNKQIAPLEDVGYLSNKLPATLNIPVLPKRTGNDFKTTHIDTDVMKAIAKLINNAKKHVRGSKTSAYLELAILEVNKVLNSLNVTPKIVYTKTTKKAKNVCPEIYKGGNFGFPLYYTGFERTHCAHSVPLSELITVIKYFKFNNSDISTEAFDKFLSSVSFTIPDVRVILSTNVERLANILQIKYPDKHISFMKNYSEGKALNMMISKVKTQYVLVARGVEYFTNDSRIERLIGEIESLNAVLAGGSFRYQNGHWSKGCFQVLYRNFTLKYFEGYDESLHECLFCDFINGPFVSTTQYLVKNEFEDLNENTGLYEDFFLRIFQTGEESVVCPDSMFHTHPKSHPHFKWNTFMEKWGLNEIIVAEGFKVFQNFDIKPNGKNIQISSLSTLQKASNSIKVIMLACLEAGVICELQEGTELGAVKLGKFLPWDIDFDIRFLSNNCSKCRQLADVFRKRGIHFGDFVKPCCNKKLKLGEINYVRIGYNKYDGDISGHPFLDSARLVENGIEPTKILFDGVWLNVPRNPGMSMRNRYGREIYQHAEHWRFTGGNAKNGNHRMNYTTNIFLPCSMLGSHRCLDRYNADGNLQLQYLLP